MAKDQKRRQDVKIITEKYYRDLQRNVTRHKEENCLHQT